MCDFMQTSMMLLVLSAGILSTAKCAGSSTTTENAVSLDRIASVEATLESFLRKSVEQENVIQSVMLKNAELEKRIGMLEVENERLNDLIAVNGNSGERNNDPGLFSGNDVNDNGNIRRTSDDSSNLDGQDTGEGANVGADEATQQSGVVKRQTSVHNIVPSGVSAVAFSACISKFEIDHLGHGQTIIYDMVITNVGNGYHNHLGVFIAPISGVYVFTFDLMLDGGYHQYFELAVDGQTAIHGFLETAQMTNSASRTGVLQVNQGSEVWIRTDSTSSGTIHGNQYTSFSGWLLAVSH